MSAARHDCQADVAGESFGRPSQVGDGDHEVVDVVIIGRRDSTVAVARRRTWKGADWSGTAVLTPSWPQAC
jgi:hypothetical protein